MVFIGFMLSPLLWWNDLFINIPLAYLFAWVCSLVYSGLFLSAFVVGYWLTNVLGFMLMHHGFRAAVKSTNKLSTKRELKKDSLLSLAYTIIVVILVLCGVIKPPTKYLQKEKSVNYIQQWKTI